MENDIQDVKEEKLKVLLHTYGYLNDRIVTNCKMAYDVGLITVTSIVLVVVYSITSRRYELLVAIPFLLLASAMIASHIMHTIVRFEGYIITKIEFAVDELIEPNTLDLSRELGVFRSKGNITPIIWFNIRKWCPFIIAYFSSMIASGILFWGKESDIIQPHIDNLGAVFLAVYIVLIPFFVLIMIPIIFEFNRWSDKINKQLSKLSQKKDLAIKKN